MNTNAPATSRQLWALFCLTKEDHRGKNLTMGQASEMISKLKAQKGNSTTSKKSEFFDLYTRAHRAGLEAGTNKSPRPMVVQEHANMLDDRSPVVHSELVMGGVCGFAWINIKPGTSAFAKWLKKKELARTDSYYGGVTVWVSEFGQSMEKKMAYAAAFANVLCEAGIKAYANSRMD